MMGTSDERASDDGLRIMVIDRQGRVTGVVELDDLLALCATVLGDLAHRVKDGPDRPAHGTCGGPEPGS
jgi:hypothetical protein